MSAILDSLLDEERRAECRANDRAMATGQPIVGSRPATVQCMSTLQPAWIERSNAAPAVTKELR